MLIKLTMEYFTTSEKNKGRRGNLTLMFRKTGIQPIEICLKMLIILPKKTKPSNTSIYGVNKMLIILTQNADNS